MVDKCPYIYYLKMRELMGYIYIYKIYTNYSYINALHEYIRLRFTAVINCFPPLPNKKKTEVRGGELKWLRFVRCSGVHSLLDTCVNL